MLAYCFPLQKHSAILPLSPSKSLSLSLMDVVVETPNNKTNSNNPMLFMSENYINPHSPPSKQALTTTFHDHFHQLNNSNSSSSSSSSSNQIILFDNNSQTTPCFDDPFDPFSFVSSSSSNPNNFDAFESKPFIENGGINMQNFHFQQPYYMNNNNNNNFLGQSSDLSLFDGGICNFNNYNNQDQMMMMMMVKPMSFAVPDDQVSCITAENGYYKEVGKNNNMIIRASVSASSASSSSRKSSIKGRKKPNTVKGQWTPAEDRSLITLVEQYGLRKWSFISQMMPGRIGKQCRERWLNHLRSNIKKDIWSDEEDRVLIQAHVEIGNKWAEIAKRLPGRTENSIKNHWNATKRKQLSRRRCRSHKNPRSSLLQEYIKSLNIITTSTKNNNKNNNIHNNAAAAAAAAAVGVDSYLRTAVSTKVMQSQPLAMDFCSSNDRLLPNYNDFNEVVGIDDFDLFDAGNILFQEGSLDSLLADEMTCGGGELVATVDHYHDHDDDDIEEGFEMTLDMGSLMDDDDDDDDEYEVKNDMDLVEMFSQVNNQ